MELQCSLDCAACVFIGFVHHKFDGDVLAVNDDVAILLLKLSGVDTLLQELHGRADCSVDVHLDRGFRVKNLWCFTLADDDFIHSRCKIDVHFLVVHILIVCAILYGGGVHILCVHK